MFDISVMTETFGSYHVLQGKEEILGFTHQLVWSFLEEAFADLWYVVQLDPVSQC